MNALLRKYVSAEQQLFNLFLLFPPSTAFACSLLLDPTPIRPGIGSLWESYLQLPLHSLLRGLELEMVSKRAWLQCLPWFMVR